MVWHVMTSNEIVLLVFSHVRGVCASMFAYMWVHVHVCACVWRPEAGAESHTVYPPHSLKQGHSGELRTC